MEFLHGKGRDYFNKGKGFRRKNKGAFCYFESRRRARRVQRPPPAPPCVAYGGRVEAIQAAGLYAPGGERLNHHQKPNKRAAFFLGFETAPKEPPERVKPQGGGGRVEATHNRKQTTRRPLCNAYTRQNKRPPLQKEQPKAKKQPLKPQNTYYLNGKGSEKQ